MSYFGDKSTTFFEKTNKMQKKIIFYQEILF